MLHDPNYRNTTEEGVHILSTIIIINQTTKFNSSLIKVNKIPKIYLLVCYISMSQIINSTIEFERKFLVMSIPFSLDQYPSLDIKQWYIKIGKNPIQRVRCINNRTYILNKKYKHRSIAGKVELEKDLSKDQFEEYIKHRIPNQIGALHKKRYSIPYGKFKIQLDCYDIKLDNLMIAEVEFDTLADFICFEPPPWFGRELSEGISNKKLYLEGLDALQREPQNSEIHDSILQTQKHIHKVKDTLKKLKKRI